MTNDGFLDWHEYHTTIFALAPEDSKTVASWRAALKHHSLDELAAASAELLLQAPKSFRNEHVPGFFKILERMRAPRKKGFSSTCGCESCQARWAERNA